MPATKQTAGKRRQRRTKRKVASARKPRRSVKKRVVKRAGSVKKTVGGKRKPSAYNMHVKKEMKKGKSMKQAAASWRAKK